MSEQAGTAAPAFQVALQGSFGPALQAAFTAMGVRHIRTTSSFIIAARDGEGICEIIEELDRRGLTILDVRPAAMADARDT
jgi:hypothetical protein